MITMKSISAEKLRNAEGEAGHAAHDVEADGGDEEASRVEMTS